MDIREQKKNQIKSNMLCCSCSISMFIWRECFIQQRKEKKDEEKKNNLRELSDLRDKIKNVWWYEV